MRLTISGHHASNRRTKGAHLQKTKTSAAHCDTIDHIEFVLVVERAKHKAEANLHLAEPTSSPPRPYLLCIRLSTRSLINSTGKSRITNENNELTKTLNGSSDVCLVVYT